jgi:hypothetical protein
VPSLFFVTVSVKDSLARTVTIRGPGKTEISAWLSKLD